MTADRATEINNKLRDYVGGGFAKYIDWCDGLDNQAVREEISREIDVSTHELQEFRCLQLRMALVCLSA
jgi:hypothetical protein